MRALRGVGVGVAMGVVTGDDSCDGMALVSRAFVVSKGALLDASSTTILLTLRSEQVRQARTTAGAARRSASRRREPGEIFEDLQSESVRRRGLHRQRRVERLLAVQQGGPLPRGRLRPRLALLLARRLGDARVTPPSRQGQGRRQRHKGKPRPVAGAEPVPVPVPVACCDEGCMLRVS